MQAGSAVERGLVVRAVFEARKNVSHTLKEASPHLLSSFSEIKEKVEVWLTDTRRGREQGYRYKLDANLDYMVNSRPVWAMEWNPVSKK